MLIPASFFLKIFDIQGPIQFFYSGMKIYFSKNRGHKSFNLRTNMQENTKFKDRNNFHPKF
jgi:hypothetical protein